MSQKQDKKIRREARLLAVTMLGNIQEEPRLFRWKLAWRLVFPSKKNEIYRKTGWKKMVPALRTKAERRIDELEVELRRREYLQDVESAGLRRGVDDYAIGSDALEQKATYEQTLPEGMRALGSSLYIAGWGWKLFHDPAVFPVIGERVLLFAFGRIPEDSQDVLEKWMPYLMGQTNELPKGWIGA